MVFALFRPSISSTFHQMPFMSENMAATTPIKRARSPSSVAREDTRGTDDPGRRSTEMAEGETELEQSFMITRDTPSKAKLDYFSMRAKELQAKIGRRQSLITATPTKSAFMRSPLPAGYVYINHKCGMIMIDLLYSFRSPAPSFQRHQSLDSSEGTMQGESPSHRLQRSDFHDGLRSPSSVSRSSLGSENIALQSQSPLRSYNTCSNLAGLRTNPFSPARRVKTSNESGTFTPGRARPLRRASIRLWTKEDFGPDSIGTGQIVS